MKNQLTLLDRALMTVTLSYRHHSTCIKRKVVALAVKEGRVLGWAVNHGNGESCACQPIEGLRHPHVHHAEEALKLKLGDELEGSTVYVSYSPCDKCAKILRDSGVVRVVYYEYSDYPEGLEILKSANITVVGYVSERNT